MQIMKKLVVFAAAVFGLAMAQQANACEWMHQAAKPATVVTCEDGTCTAQQPAQESAQEAPAPAATETAPAPSQAAEDTAPASNVVASVQR
jgi:hypothetical protein